MEMMYLAVVFVLASLYLYFQSLYQHWTRKGLPQPTPVPLVGNVLKAVFKIKNMGLIFTDIYWKYRDHDAVGFYVFLSPKLMLIKPKLIKQVMISEFSNFHDNEMYASQKTDPYLQTNSFLIKGDKWKPARLKLLHGLTTSKLRLLYTLMTRDIAHLDSYIAHHAGQDVEVKEMSSLFSLTVVSNCVFGIESDCFSDVDSPFRRLTSLLHQEYWHTWWRTMLIFYLPKLRDMLGYGFMPPKISNFMEAMVRQVAEERKNNGTIRNDFIQSYLSREKPYEENVVDMINNGMVFFIAGTETSSVVAANTLYALAQHPDIQEKVYQELREAHGDNSALSYDTISALPYLDKVLQESHRMYPTLYTMSKVCTKTTVLEIDGQDVKIEEGTTVMIPTLAVHRDPEYYPDPEVFDPERFSEEGVTSRPECTYLSWGEGPRICLGKKYAETQIKLYLSHIVYKYKILATERTPKKLTYDNFAFLMKPTNQIYVRLQKRE